jgi:hypothetical protein
MLSSQSSKLTLGVMVTGAAFKVKELACECIVNHLILGRITEKFRRIAGKVALAALHRKSLVRASGKSGESPRNHVIPPFDGPY